MAIKKKGTAPEKAEEDGRPYQLVVDEDKKLKGIATSGADLSPDGERLRGITSDSTKDKVRVEDGSPVPWRRGPQIGERNLGDGDYLKNFATPQELAVFRAAVVARRAKVAKTEWRELPDGSRIPGDRVLVVCFKCGSFAWVKPEQATSYCVYCNPMLRVGGGKFRGCSQEEEKNWFEHEKARFAKWQEGRSTREAEERLAANIRMRLGGKG